LQSMTGFEKRFLGFLPSYYWGKEGLQSEESITKASNPIQSLQDGGKHKISNVVLKSALEFKLNSSSFSIFT